MQQIILDKTRTLRFSRNSVRWLERELRRPGQTSQAWLEEFDACFRGPDGKLTYPGFEIAQALLWVCLRTEDKSLDLDQVGDLMPPDRESEIFLKCYAEFNAFFGVPDSGPLSEGSPTLNGGPSAATTSDSVN